MKYLIQLIKLPPVILAGISIGIGLVLFLPTRILNALGLDNIPGQMRTLLGLAFIVSLSLCIVYLVLDIAKFVISKYYDARIKRNLPNVMSNLREPELKVVAALYSSPNYTLRLPSNDGVIARLLAKGIIQHTSLNCIAIGNELSIPYTITPLAQSYIDEHPEIIYPFIEYRMTINNRNNRY